MEKRCQNCGIRRANRPRQMCYTCYYRTPEARDNCPSTSKFAPRSCPDRDYVSGRALPPAPTEEVPGTEAKLAVLAERFSLRASLWHPGDFPAKNDLS